VLTQISPDLGGQVAGLVDREIIQHGAQRGDFRVEKGLLLACQHIGPSGEQGVKVGPAGKQPAFETDGARFQCGPFCVAHHRQGLGKGFHGGLA
jgi:hypothetical protein